MDKLTLPTNNTWCPGCGNFPLFEGLKKGLQRIEKKGGSRENFVLVGGIGCHGKIVDYINVNTFYGLHGRALPVAEGIKAANPDLKVICSSGDGDSYNEGISHLIHAAKRNIDITVIIHDNHNFALTVKQFTSTSPKGFKGSSTPSGSVETPINPLRLMLGSGATFVARGYAAKMDHLADLVERGVKHKGFSFIEVLQPCVTWFNTFAKYNERVYEYEPGKKLTRDEATRAVGEWDYNNGDKIPVGLFYQEDRPSFDEESFSGTDDKKKVDVGKLLKRNV